MIDAAGDGGRLDVAVVGLAGVFPGAPDVEAFWQRIRSADVALVPYPHAPDDGFRFGSIREYARFDPLRFGVIPRALDGTEPDQWLGLQGAADALWDAGFCEPTSAPSRTAVILGKGTYLNRGNTTYFHQGQFVSDLVNVVRQLHPEWGCRQTEMLTEAVRAALPPFGSDTVGGLIPNNLTGRIANRFNFCGPSFTVDAACASSLVALRLAGDMLRSGEVDLAVAGGVQVVTPMPVFKLFSALGALTRSGLPHPFDRAADGTALGEGLGLLVLQRLEDALAQNRPLYAVVRSIGVASDGRGTSVLTPNPEGPIAAMRAAYAAAGVSPATIDYLEAHATGTRVGDEVELSAIQDVFAELKPGSCGVGTLKSMIGHLLPAAGASALIKMCLALAHEVLPPTGNVLEPCAALRRCSGLRLIAAPGEYWGSSEGRPRRAGVSAFGFGGINAHAVLEQAPPGCGRPRDQPTRVFRSPPERLVTLETDWSPLRLGDAAVMELRESCEANPPASINVHRHPRRRSAPAERGDATDVGAGDLATAFQATMRAFLDTQQRVLVAAATRAHGGSRLAGLPFVVAATPSPGGAKVQLVIDLARHPVWLDHVMGEASRCDPGQCGWVLAPFTLLLELLAQAALAWRPGLKVLGFSNARVHRWLHLAAQQTHLIAVVKGTHATRASVRLFEAAAQDEILAIAEGEVLLGEQRRALPSSNQPVHLTSDPSGPLGAELYDRAGMFHRGTFRGVVGLTDLESRSAAAVLRPTPAHWRFQTDPILLDLLGQVVGFWGLRTLADAHPIMFPVGVRSIRLARQLDGAAGDLYCRTVVRELGEDVVVSDIELRDRRGDVLISVEGWRDQRMPLPRPFERLILTFGSESIGEAVSISGASAAPIAGQLVPTRLLDASVFARFNGFLAALISHSMLSHAERDEYASLGGVAKAGNWMIERVAAKQAVRGLLLAGGSEHVPSCDLELQHRGAGSYEVLLLQQTGPSRVALVATRALSEGILVCAQAQGAASGQQCTIRTRLGSELIVVQAGGRLALESAPGPRLRSALPAQTARRSS